MSVAISIMAPIADIGQLFSNAKMKLVAVCWHSIILSNGLGLFLDLELLEKVPYMTDLGQADLKIFCE